MLSDVLCLWFTSWMSWVERTRLGKILFRFLPIIISLWTLTDIAFDAIQAKEYRDYSITGIENCTYNESTVNGTNEENQTKKPLPNPANAGNTQKIHTNLSNT